MDNFKLIQRDKKQNYQYQYTLKNQMLKDLYKDINKIKELVQNTNKFNEDLEILKYLNSGSCGIVYEGQIRRIPSKRVALKFIFSKIIENKRKKNLILKEKMTNKISKEIFLQNKLKHKNITSLLGVYEIENDCTCIVMELSKYGDLYHFQKSLLQKKYLSETLLAYITKQILNGLNFCHQSKIIHMDIKHQNVLIDDKLNVKLTDLSVSYSYADFSPRSKIVLPFVGTTFFMSPEVLGKKEIDVEDLNKIDMFSLGILLFNLAYKYYPYDLSIGDKRFFDLIKLKIENNELVIPNDERYSYLFRNFVSRLLNKNIKLRMSISEAMNHPWMKGATLIFWEKEKIFHLEKFLISVVTDTIKSFNDFLLSKY